MFFIISIELPYAETSSFFWFSNIHILVENQKLRKIEQLLQLNMLQEKINFLFL
ncbi:hypothetical protein EFD32_1148 [Enterococcus faecalis D32]|nr:hypothetical protein EFD32_1148 [Enterococcus faecalis D32]